MGLQYDTINKNQNARKVLISKFEDLCENPPSPYSTNEVRDWKKKADKIQAEFLLECQGAIFEIDVLKRSNFNFAEQILDLTGVERNGNGHHDLAKIQAVIDLNLMNAYKRTPKPHKVKTPLRDPSPMDEALAEKEAEQARELLEPLMVAGPVPGILAITQNHDLDVEATEVEEVETNGGSNSTGRSGSVDADGMASAGGAGLAEAVAGSSDESTTTTGSENHTTGQISTDDPDGERTGGNIQGTIPGEAKTDEPWEYAEGPKPEKQVDESAVAEPQANNVAPIESGKKTGEKKPRKGRKAF